MSNLCGGLLFLPSMIFLYNLGVRLYALLAKASSPFNAKAKKFIKGRKNVFGEIRKYRSNEKGPVAWFHAASLGEFEQGLPVMERFKEEFPSYSIVVSFFSPSGYEHRKEHPIADLTCYLPIDTKANAKRFLDELKPNLACFIKYEYWFHFLKEADQRSIPLFSISAIFTPNHIFFKKYGSFHRQMLQYFDHTFVQNTKSEYLLKSIGVEDCSISGDTRFDRVSQTVASPESYADLEKFCGNKTTLIVGSAWPEDMAVLADFINAKSGEINIIIAPHLIDRAHVEKITSHLSVPFKLYSDGNLTNTDSVLILNTIGMLSSTYQYADFAYIGGAFGDGLHNILEAVAFGLPVVFGNKGLEKFPESEELITLGGAFSVEDAQQTQDVLNNLLIEGFRKGASDICLQYVTENQGATERIISYLKEELK